MVFRNWGGKRNNSGGAREGTGRKMGTEIAERFAEEPDGVHRVSLPLWVLAKALEFANREGVSLKQFIVNRLTMPQVMACQA